MFDTNKVASNIKNARTKMNMTQMNLADEMGVSYQAVSNWERGNSMPDISKLPELCKILNLSFEELVGEKSEQTDITERLMKGEEAEVSLEEMAQVVPLVTPEKLEVKVEEAINKEEKISFATLIGLAPFMDKERLGKMAEELADIDLKKLTALAPFLHRKTLDKIMERQLEMGSLDTNRVVSIAPFLAKETVQKIVEYLIANGQSEKVIAIAPFMGKQISDDSDEEEKDLDDLEEDDVAELAFAALENGNDVEEYLDYMDEDDVAKLAFKALDLGKPLEEYLDYLDEDTIKKLLLKSIRK